MSVMMVTSLGDIVVDLFTEKCPLTCKNFLKLCKVKYYNGCLFHTVQKDFTAQTGDPTGTGAGGDSIYKFLFGDQARFFSDEIHLDLKHSKTGTVAMASAGENLNASQFYFTLRDDLDYLDGKHTVFGEVAEGLETLTRINEAYVDDKSRPYKNIRIKHTYILDDPFDDPPQLAELIPDASPEGKPKDEVDNEVRLEDDWVPIDEELGPGELEELLRDKEARSNAVVLESIGDIPDADIKPPENVLFVCKLNPVTEDEDLHTIFSRFGTVISAEVIRDYKTGDSLCYAFIEFETKEACEQAYFKMDNALIDDRRIHVDFSQSVSKLWNQFRRGGNQKGKGRGCFKCGALDHLAKDCTGGPGQPPKYILKDTNMQHGGDNSRYKMVFDDDTPQSPRPHKKHGRYDRDDQLEKPKLRKRSSDDREYRDQEKKDSIDRHVQSNRNREQGEVDTHRESKASQYREDRTDKGKHLDRRKELEQDDERRYDRDHRKRSSDAGRGDRRETGSYGKKTAVDDREDRRDRCDYEKRSGDGDYKKKYVDDDSHRRDTRDDRDHKRRREDEERRGSRNEHSYRKYDDHRGRREDLDYRRRGIESDDEYDRRQHRVEKRN